MWKATKFIGVGIDWNKNGKVVIVVRYKPAGNKAGFFQDNVSPISMASPLSDHTSTESEDDQGQTNVSDKKSYLDLLLSKLLIVS